MKGLLLALSFSVLASAAVAQKVEVKGDAIVVDGAKYALIEQDGCKVMSPQCHYYLKSLDGKRLFVVKQLEFKDPAEINAADPEGRVLYLQFVFTASGAKAEIAYPAVLGLRPIDVARKVVKAELFSNGSLSEQAVADFVTNNGAPFTERQKALAGPKVIVIEKN